MSILIKNIKMPKDEPLLVKINPDGIVSTTASNNYKKYEAVELSPHGRLIDREKMLDAIRLELAQAEACEDMEDYESWLSIFNFVRKFPIIEAEEEAK